MNRCHALVCFALATGTSVTTESASPCLMYDVQTTTSVTIRCPAFEKAQKVLFLDVNGKWANTQPGEADGPRVVRIDVAQIKAGRTILLVDPPKWMDCNDRTPPVPRSITIDGKSMPPKDTIDLGTLGNTPGDIVVTFEDQHNPLKATGIHATLDGCAIPEDAVQIETNNRQTICRVTPVDMDYGAHDIAVVATDAAPLANSAAVHIRFTYLDTNDIAQASLGAKVNVDSCFSGYGPETLIDGDSQSCAAAGSPAASWASAETGTAHWVEVVLPKLETIESVALYWAYRKPSKRVEAHIHKDGKWTTVGTAERKQSEQLASTIRFTPVKTDRIRVLQPSGCGQESRPNLLWVGEISVRKSN